MNILSKIWPSLVVTVALLGFGMLAFNAYKENNTEQIDIPLIKADNAPIKEKPIDEEGMKIPHRDKEIYKVISDEKIKETETLLPPEEKPIKKEIKEAVKITEPYREEPAIIKKAVQKSIPINTTANTTTNNKIPIPQLKPKVPSKPITKNPTSGISIQLGAYNSTADAEKAWDKIQLKNSNTLGKSSPYIVKVKINNKIFYRLRASSFKSEQTAEKVCDSFKNKGQGCFVVK